jgi:hypothetical protein
MADDRSDALDSGENTDAVITGASTRDKRRAQRGLPRERSSRIELRYVALGRERSGFRSASSRAHRRKRGDLVAWPLLPCFRLPIPPRPCCIDRAYSTATAGNSWVSGNSDSGF